MSRSQSRLRELLVSFGPMLQVGVGLGVFGIANYGFLAVVGRDLGPSGSAAVSVAWTLVNLLGIGLFQPLEQETTRQLSETQSDTALQTSLAPVRKYGVLATTSISVLLAVLARPVGELVFEGRTLIPILIALALVAQSLAYYTRGLMSGNGRFAGYGIQLLTDGLFRVALALGLALSGTASQEAYVGVLVLAPLGSVLVTLHFLDRRHLALRIAHVRDARMRPILVLVLASLSAQLLANIGPPMIAILAGPEETAVSGAFVAAVTVARVPLFLFAAIQAVFLPQLVRLRSQRDHASFARAHRRGLLVTCGIALVGLTAVALAGDAILMAIYGSGFNISGTAFTLLAASGALLMIAQVFAQGLLAHRQERAAAVAWLAGALVAVLVAWVPLDLDVRVSLALSVGGLISLLVAAILFQRETRRWNNGPHSQIQLEVER